MIAPIQLVLQFFDFFSVPGQDPKRNPGSPLILIEELERKRHQPQN